MAFRTQKTATGFTVVELLIVIVVIGILAAIAIVGFNGAQRSAAGATLQSDLRNAAKYVKLVAAEGNGFPANLSAFSGDPGVDFEYTPGNDGTYCITASSEEAGVEYYYDSATGEQVEGTCPGHSGLGGPAGPDPATSWSAISMGGFHDCAISNGAAYCWGGPGLGNSFDGMGQGVREVQPVPVPVLTDGVLAGKTITRIAAGSSSSCAVDSDGLMYCWGSNTNGVLARTLTTSTNSPALAQNTGVLAGKTITDLTVGSQHGCVVASSEAFCWGSGTSGSLGQGFIGNSSVPVAVETGGVLNGLTVTKTTASHSSASYAYTCAIASGQAFCWGDGRNGAIGNGSIAQQTSPQAVSTAGVLAGKTVTDISAGEGHVCAIADAQAFCWGWGNSGRLGDGSATNRTLPVAVRTDGALNGIELTKIVAGGSATCALGENRLFCWGSNSQGIFGNGTTTSSNNPIEVPLADTLAGRQIVDFSMRASACILLSDGQAYCWGNSNSTTPIGTGQTTDVLSPQLLIAPWL